MRTFITFLFLMSFSIGFSQNLEEGLIVHYPFNGNFNDTSVNQFHGITNAAFTDDRFGNPNAAINFNGIDQYLDFPPVKPALKPNLPVSFAFWIKFRDTSPFVTLILTTDYAQDKHTGAWVSTTWDGALSCGYGDGTGNGPYSRRSKSCTTILESGVWYHVIVIINGRYNMTVYLDCVEEDGYYEGSGDYMVYTDCQGSIGRKDSGVGYPPIYFYGAMDDFRYWNRALTMEEIDSLCLGVSVSEQTFQAENAITLFPNPATNVINIANMPGDVAQIEMVDTFGKTIRTFDAVNQIPMEGLSAGVYFLRFIDDRKAIVARKKFVMQ